MKVSKNIKNNIVIVLVFITGVIASSFRTTDRNILGELQENELYRTIVEMDSIYFTAYNNCDMKKQAALYDEDLEFYHDIGGLVTSKKEILESLEKNICGKVTRELVAGSIEVHPIPGFGAVQMGMHKFHNTQEPDAVAVASKFITIWKQDDDAWKITRVISLH